MRATGALGDMPLIVITALGSDHEPRRNATATHGESAVDRRDGALGRMARYGAGLQEELAARPSTHTQHIITRDSGHQISLTRPDLVVDAIHSVIATSGAGVRTAPLITREDQRALAEGGS